MVALAVVPRQPYVAYSVVVSLLKLFDSGRVDGKLVPVFIFGCTHICLHNGIVHIGFSRF